MQEINEFFQLKRYFKRKQQKEDEVMLAQILNERKIQYHIEKQKQIDELNKKIEQLRK